MIKNFIFLGAPGVGKGTMAKMLADRKGLKHISTGDIFRSNIKNKTKLGIKVESILAAGKYVTDELTNALVKDALNKEEVKKSGFILDGYPRTQGQAKFLEDNNYNISEVLLLEADEDIIKKRLISRAIKENRKDDTPEVIADRIKIYNEKTSPLISYYNEKGLIVKCNCEGDLENIYNEIIKVLF